MGLELDLFSEIYPVKDLKIYFVTSIFIPGSHYDDVLGLPLNRRQKKALEHIERITDPGARIPNLGNDTAYTFNLGMEYRF